MNRTEMCLIMFEISFLCEFQTFYSNMMNIYVCIVKYNLR